MKKLQWALGAVIVLFLAACSMPGGTGSLKVKVPAASRAVDGKGDQVRLQLVRNNSILPLSGKPFLQDSLSGQTIALNGLPTGGGYSLVLSTGTTNSDGYFVVVYAGTSPTFEITAGVDTAVDVTLAKTPVELFSSGSGQHLAQSIDDTDLWLLNGTGLYQLAAPADLDLDNPTITLALGTKTLNSLGFTADKDGTQSLVINTSAGLGVRNGTSFDFTMSSPTGALSPLPDVRHSDVFHVGASSLKVYMGTGLTAGMAVVDSSTPTAKWQDVVKLLNLPDDLASNMTGAEGIIKDVAATGQVAYVSTAIGVFRVDSAMLASDDDDATTALGHKIEKGDADIKVGVRVGGRAVGIGPVGAFHNGTTGLVFAGTTRGLFSAATDADGRPPQVDGAYNSLTLVDGTFGQNIADIESTNLNGTAYTAAWAKNTGDLFILKGNAVERKLTTLSGLPDGTLSFTWWHQMGTTNTLKLVVSGDNGTVTIDEASF